MPLRKWKDKYYQLDIRYNGIDGQPQRLRVVVPTTSNREAESVHDAIEQYLTVGGPSPIIELAGEVLQWQPKVKPQRECATTIDELLIFYRATFDERRRMRIRSVETEEARLRRIAKEVGNTAIEDAEKTVFAFMAKAAKELAPTTQRKYKEIWIRLLDLAIEKNVLASNPARKLPKIRSVKFVPNPLWNEEVPVFLDLANKHAPKHAEFWEFEIVTGLRRGEAAGLLWGDINVAHKQMRVQRSSDRLGRLGPTKGGDSRVVPLTDRALAILRNQPHGELNDRVFRTIAGEPILPTWGKKPFKNVVAMMNRARPTRPHDLRHTFGTMMASMGVGEEAIRRWMGHKTLSVTRDYVHINPIGSEVLLQFGAVNGLVNGWANSVNGAKVVPLFGPKNETVDQPEIDRKSA